MSAVNSLQLWDCARRCGYYRSLPQSAARSSAIFLVCLSLCRCLCRCCRNSSRSERLLTWFISFLSPAANFCEGPPPVCRPGCSILLSENATLLGGMRDSPLGVTESRDGSPQPGIVVPWYRRRLSTLHNFVLMCVAFSCNHGAVTSVLGISVTLLGDNGSYMDGALYVMYALTALLFATAPLDLLG